MTSVLGLLLSLAVSIYTVHSFQLPANIYSTSDKFTEPFCSPCMNKTTEALLVACRKSGIEVHVEKIKYVIIWHE